MSDLSKLTDAQLRRELKKREVASAASKATKRSGTTSILKKKKKVKFETLAKRSKKQVKEEKDINVILAKNGIARKTAKAKAAFNVKHQTSISKMQKKGKLAKTGKYERSVAWVKITINFSVDVYSGGKVVGSYKSFNTDYFGIRWNGNNPTSYMKKLKIAKERMLERVGMTMESGSELTSHNFVTKQVMNKRQLNLAAGDPTKIAMLGVAYDEVKSFNRKPIHYKFIPADVNAPTDGFTCTDSYLMEAYKKQIPSLNQAKLDSIMGKVNKNIGRTCVEIDKFCEQFKISHYALDFKHNVFFKEVRGQSNYKALIYYCVNSHLYPVTDKKTRDSICKKSAARSQKSTSGTNLKAALDEGKIVDKENEQIELFKKTRYEDVPMKKVMDYEDCNIFYHTHTLYSHLIELFKLYKFAYDCMYTADKMTCIVIPEKKIHLFANMNHRTSNPDKRGKDGVHVPYDWNDVEAECKALRIPFLNQSFTGVGKMVQGRFDVKGKKRCIRLQLTKLQREKMWSEQGKKCAGCGKAIAKDAFEVDHIIPLGKGGDNSRPNLQGLCKPCHKTKTNKETSERCFDTDNTQSDYNKNTLQVFKTVKNGFIHNFDSEKHWEHRVEKGISHTMGFDICKCRTETALRMEYEWCVYSVFDDVQVFNKKKHAEIPRGVYRIETNNYLPFKGTGWYSYNLVIKSLKRGIISLDNITHCVLASLALPANYYAKFIEYVRENVANKNLAKPIINMFIGSLGHKVTKHRKVFLTTSINEASYHKFTAAESDDMNVHVVRSKEVDGLFEVVTNTTRYVESNHVPIFNQILDEEAWQLYEIAELLRKHNCRSMIYYNTDNAIAEFRNKEDVEACKKEGMRVFWDKEKKFPKYKVATDIHNMERVERDEHGDNLVEKLAAGKVVRPIEMEVPKYEELYEDEGSNDVSRLVSDLVDAYQAFMIQGRAGTGKSFILKRFIEELHRRGQTYLTLCPTHKACRSLDEGLNIEGHKSYTLDSQWAIIKHAGSDPFSHKDWVIIDEKSFVKEGFWKQILQILHRNPKCRFVICGDWDQLPPVADRCEFNYETSVAMWEICGGRILNLTHCRRLDKKGQKLFKMCKDVHAIDLKQFPSDECEKSLAYNNRVRIAVNKRWMEQKSVGRKHITVPAIAGKSKETQETRIYKGLPLIAIESNSTHEICNAEEFRVLSFTDKVVTIAPVLEKGISEDVDDYKEIPLDVFPHMLQPAYCISVHRSQCSTYREPYTIYQTEKMRDMDKNGGDLGKRLLYVALSRASDISLINISDEY